MNIKITILTCYIDDISTLPQETLLPRLPTLHCLSQALCRTLIGLTTIGCAVDNMLTRGEAERSNTTSLTFRLTVE